MAAIHRQLRAITYFILFFFASPNSKLAWRLRLSTIQRALPPGCFSKNPPDPAGSAGIRSRLDSPFCVSLKDRSGIGIDSDRVNLILFTSLTFYRSVKLNFSTLIFEKSGFNDYFFFIIRPYSSNKS